MTTSIFIVLLFCSSLSLSSANPKNATTVNQKIWKACKATRHPEPCQFMLTKSGRVRQKSSPQEIIQAALHVSGQKLKTGQSMIKEILETSTQNPNRTKVAQTCLESLDYSSLRARAAEQALSHDRLRDARAWASSALNFQHGCWGGLKYVNDTPLVNKALSYFETEVIVSTGNALSMMRALDALGDDTVKWTPPRTERDGFWEPVVGSESGLGMTHIGFKLAGMEANVTVCKSGCRYSSVQEAVDMAPENLKSGEIYVIKIKAGVYVEIVRVPFPKKNLVFLGAGMGKTVITGSRSFGLQGINTFHTATVGILADGFMASGLTIQNKAGVGAHQAVAFRSDSDFSYIENCEFLGNQDTVYTHSLRQLYSNCIIQGNIDFIFGNAAAIFKNCTILICPRQENPDKGGASAITAHGRSDPAQTTGFAFVGCHIDGTPDYMELYKANPSIHRNYLGRPWKMYSRTVFINCTMGELIHPEGWMPWDGDFALSTVYYGEYGNSGRGANVSERVPWSRLIPAERISTFTVRNFLQGDEWITKSFS